MFTRKNLITLLLAFVALVTVTLLIVSQTERGDSMSKAPLLAPKLSEQLNRVDSIVLTKSGTILSFVKEDGNWTIASRNHFPASVQPLRELLTQLSEARLVEEKTRNRDKYHRLNVADLGSEGEGVLLTVSGEGQTFIELVIGKKSNGFKGQYVRRKDENVSFLLDKQLTTDFSIERWVDDELLTIERATIQSIESSGHDQSFVLARDAKDSNWNLTPKLNDGESLKSGYQLNGFVGALEKLLFTDVLDKKSFEQLSDANKEKTIVYQTFEGDRYTLELWLQNGEYWLGLDVKEKNADAQETGEVSGEDESTESNESQEAQDTQRAIEFSKWYFKISNFKASELNKTREDLLEQTTISDE